MWSDWYIDPWCPFKHIYVKYYSCMYCSNTNALFYVTKLLCFVLQNVPHPLSIYNVICDDNLDCTKIGIDSLTQQLKVSVL